MNMRLGNTQVILKKCRDYDLLKNQTAYVLATAYWETGRTMKPVKEAYWLSESWRKNNLRYYPWYGRGYVQLTWEANYKKASKKLGIPELATNPEVALKPKVAAEVLVRGMFEGWFTGKKLKDYITLEKTDFRNARRIVNAMDKADEIMELAMKYEAELEKEREKSDKETSNNVDNDSKWSRLVSKALSGLVHWWNSRSNS